ncbi:MAG TPA: trehalase-like domain-containing protein, partial [Acetobacteraceae bacterium]
MAASPGSGPPQNARQNARPQTHAGASGHSIPSIEDYALIGDCHSAALVSREGSIDWLCWPRFDSPACFAALVGTPDNGRWLIGPAVPARVHRQYRPGTLILETVFETEQGSAALIDFMTASNGNSSVVRIVE